jgi:hypothetical protein
MRVAVAAVMYANAALFFFGALQHAGISLGRFHEPYILPAAIVETICGLALAAGASAALTGWRPFGMALLGNVVALAGVLLGKAALAAGRGPRTASNDLYHNLMLVLIGVSIVLLFLGHAAFQGNRGGACPLRHAL